MEKRLCLSESRFSGMKPFESHIWLSSPTMHGDEQRWVDEAIRTNWVSTVGENINEVEHMVADKIGRKYAVALSSGTPGKMDEIKKIADSHHALIVEDAAESFGAAYCGIITGGKMVQTGNFGDVSIISLNGNKIVTGSSGGLLLTDELEWANKTRKWSTQSREDAPWYQHEEMGYNYRMSNIVAGVARGQIPYLKEHIIQKKAIYERYKEGLKKLPISMNPVSMDGTKMESNYWLSCLLINKDAMCQSVYGDKKRLYIGEKGKSCPTEILGALSIFNAEGRPIWKPMHMQPIYRMNGFITVKGNGRGGSNAYIKEPDAEDVSTDIFERGMCLPSDNKMSMEQVDKICEIVSRCFD